MIVRLLSSDGETELGGVDFANVAAGDSSSIKLFIQNMLSRNLYNVVGRIFQYLESDMYTFTDWAYDIETLSCPFNVEGALAPSGTLTASTKYYYRVTAYNMIGETCGSIEISLTTDAVNKTITLDWSPVVGATGYKIYRSTNQDYIGSLVGDFIGETPTGWIDNGLVALTGFDLPVINTTAATGGVNYGTAPTGTSFFATDLNYPIMGVGEQKIIWMRVIPGIALSELDNPRNAAFEFYEGA